MNYEEYMRNVLGYSTSGYENIYNNIHNRSYNPDITTNYNYAIPNISQQEDAEDLNTFYPEIYKLLNPMVCKICMKNANREMTNELLEEMTNEIYKNFEPETREDSSKTTQLKNGDVRNPNAKEPEVSNETRQRNFLLRDLIRILLLNNFIKNRQNPPRPIPPYQQYPGSPVMPSRPPYGIMQTPLNQYDIPSQQRPHLF